jgi:UDP-N-acetylglucosamine 3-dehydrogenase
MGRHHARNYYESPETDLRAIVDVDATRAITIAEQYGCRPLTSVEELLELDLGVEAVSVAAPTSLHHRIAGLLLKSGRHVLVEKPIAATVEEGEDLVQIAATSGVVLAVGHIERFNPVVSELKHRLEAGELGDPLSLLARRVGVMPPQIQDANVIVDLGIHDIDIFRHLLGAADADAVHCHAGSAVTRDRYDYAEIFLRFGGVGCYAQVNWLTPVKIRSLAVTGTQGYVEIGYVQQTMDIYRAQAARDVDTFTQFTAYGAEPERVRLKGSEPLALELAGFLAAVRGDRNAHMVTGEDAVRSLALVNAAVAAVGSS